MPMSFSGSITGHASFDCEVKTGKNGGEYATVQCSAKMKDKPEGVNEYVQVRMTGLSKFMVDRMRETKKDDFIVAKGPITVKPWKNKSGEIAVTLEMVVNEWDNVNGMQAYVARKRDPQSGSPGITPLNKQTPPPESQDQSADDLPF